MTAGRVGHERVDKLLVERGLCESRSRAQALVIAGKVIVGDHKVDKPGTLVRLDLPVRVIGEEHPFVSRGGVKLAGAIDAFAPLGLVVRDRVAMDVGASTGGFTDCLLQAGVTRVHAVDVGYGQLAWKLAQDERVVVHDRRNIRKLDPSEIGEPVSLIVVDCSFIALAKVIGHLPRFMGGGGDVVALVKPQFELGKGRVGKGGIVRNARDRAEAIELAIAAATAEGLVERGRCDSPIAGRDGNREAFAWFSHPAVR